MVQLYHTNVWPRGVPTSEDLMMVNMEPANLASYTTLDDSKHSNSTWEFYGGSLKLGMPPPCTHIAIGKTLQPVTPSSAEFTYNKAPYIHPLPSNNDFPF